jgi:effector-binding domain-containing protein
MPEFETVDVKAHPMLYVERKSSMAPDDIAHTMDEGITALGTFIAEQRISPSGPPLAIYSDWDGEQMTVRVGFPVSPGDLEKARGDIAAGHTPSGRSLKALHHGAYSRLRETYATLEKHFANAHAAMPALTWENYVSDPETTPEADLITEIYMPLPET